MAELYNSINVALPILTDVSFRWFYMQASAYLLECMGDVPGALALLLLQVGRKVSALGQYCQENVELHCEELV